VKNNSSTAIYFSVSTSFPDTTLLSLKHKPYLGDKVIPSDRETMGTMVFAINPIVQIFIFDATVIEQEPWDSIVVHHKVLKRYQLSEEGINYENDTITYP
jgi:hypothetical protein